MLSGWILGEEQCNFGTTLVLAGIFTVQVNMLRHCHGQSSLPHPDNPTPLRCPSNIGSLISLPFRQSVLQLTKHLHSAYKKMLYFVGLGLGDAKDITVRGLEIVKRCEKVFLEHYTSILTVGKEELEKFYGREVDIKLNSCNLSNDVLSLKVILADRDLVEQGAEEILEGAREKEVATF